MFNFLQTIWQDLHPILVHFAIGGLFLSFAFSLLNRLRANATLNETSWVLLAVGALAALPSVVTGLIAHEPYENTAVASAIQPHQLLGMLGTLATLALLVWRWRSRRAGKDIGQSGVYGVFALLGLAWLFVLGGTGGNLVYQFAVNVRAINPLLK